jgi:AraC family ethanolamine operon transcriptional activator
MSSPHAIPSPNEVFISHVRLRDVDDQALSLSGWEQEYHQLSPGSYEGSVSWCSMKGIEFFVESSNQQVHQAGSIPADSVALALPLACEGQGWISGQPVGQDTMIVLTDQRPLDFRTPLTLSVAAIVVAMDDFLRYAGVFDCEAAVAAAMAQGAVTLPTLMADHLRDCLASVARSVAGEKLALNHGNALAAFRNNLLSGFVNALGGSATATATQAPARSAVQHRRTVERAVQYMRSHASEPIGVVDICQAVGVHSRVLQYCFNEVFGVTPVAYLRCLRLHQVRREIKESPNESLGDIAARWGIWHLGRFASDYKRLFGELPSTTARNAGSMPALAPRVALPN